MTNAERQTWYGLREAARFLGISPPTLARRSGLYKTAGGPRPGWEPDGARVFGNGGSTPMWSLERLREIQRGLKR